MMVPWLGLPKALRRGRRGSLGMRSSWEPRTDGLLSWYFDAEIQRASLQSANSNPGNGTRSGIGRNKDDSSAAEANCFERLLPLKRLIISNGKLSLSSRNDHYWIMNSILNSIIMPLIIWTFPMTSKEWKLRASEASFTTFTSVICGMRHPNKYDFFWHVLATRVSALLFVQVSTCRVFRVNFGSNFVSPKATDNLVVTGDRELTVATLLTCNGTTSVCVIVSLKSWYRGRFPRFRVGILISPGMSERN